MTTENIIATLETIFKDVLDNDSISLKPASTANDVDGWDSLSHIQIVVAIEKKYKIRFNSKEIQSWQNVQNMVDSIQSKIAN